MITRITLDNMYSKGGKKEYITPGKLILNKHSTMEEWEELNPLVDIIRKVKELFRYETNIITNFENDPSRESTLEIQTEDEGKIYTYSLVFCNSMIVMESLLEGQNWIFSRLIDNPDFALNPAYLNDKGKKCYKNYRETFPASLLFCFKPGEKLLKELKDIIVVDDWMKMRHQEFVDKFESTFPDFSYNELINKMITTFFSEDYSGLGKDNQTLGFAKKPEIKIDIMLAGSGFLRLSRLFPLMVVSKKKGLMMIATEPYDLSLHPILGKELMTWFLDGNSNPPIGKLVNVEL
jgi:hypothetical protein